MAFAPLSLSHRPPPVWHRPLPPQAAPQAQAIRDAGREAERAGNALEEELASFKESSLELRLIRAMLLKEKPSAEAEAAVAQAEPADDAELSLSMSQQQSLSLDLELAGPHGTVSLEIEQSQSLAFNLTVEADGDWQLEARLSQSVSIELELQQQPAQAPGKRDPLVLDLDGDGLETTGIEAGVRFDIDGDGSAERLSVASAGDALLALDVDGNGRIDDGRELFGDQNGAANGFEELRRHDGNGDGRLDAEDAIYARLRLLSFQAGGNQVLQDLASAGVTAIDLAYRNELTLLASGDLSVQRGRFEYADGREGEAADLLLHFDGRA